MIRVRVMTIAVLALALAVSAPAQVTLGIGPGGKKIIYNMGPTPHAGTSGGNLAWLAKQRDRASVYDAIIERHADKHGIDPVLAKAVIQVESNYNPRCVSKKGARGLMQLMPETARRFGARDIFDPEQNIGAGVAYLAVLMRMFSGDLSRVLAAYNAGENAVLRYSGIPPYSETQTYVERALTVYYGRPWGSGSISFAGGRGPKLAGGFGRAIGNPLAALTAPVGRSFKYLGSH